MRPRPLASLRASARSLAARPATVVALGAAVLLSLGAVCCGLGVLAGPWFLVELFAVLLSNANVEPPRRTRAWLGAGLFLLGAVVLISSASWIVMLGFGPGTSLALGAAEPAPWSDLAVTTAFAGGGALLAQACILPWLYAPLVLIDRGGRIGGAALESARLVADGGWLAHLGLAASANAVQFAPAFVAAIVAARLVAPAAAPVAIAIALPLLAVTIPLGQGMVVDAYLARRTDMTDAHRAPMAAGPPRVLTICLACTLAAPVLAASLVGVALGRSSRVQPDRAPAGELVASARVTGTEHRVLWIPDALRIDVSSRGVYIEASDEGGTGSLPLATTLPIRRVDVRRVRDAYAVVISTDRQQLVTWIDRAGVRLDDDLRARLLDRVPAWGIAALLLTLAMIALAVGPALASLGVARRLWAAADPPHEKDPRLVAARARAVRRAWIATALVAPAAVASLVAASMALT